MIDISLAHIVARRFTQSEPVPNLGVDIQALADRSMEVLSEYTGLTPDSVPPAELVSRDEWVGLNLESMAGVFEVIDRQIDGQLEKRIQEKNLSPVMKMMAQAASGFAVSSEVALLLSYLSQRVLGQVEAALFLPDAKLRLVFVAQNLDLATQRMDVDGQEFLHWVVLHELTHVYQFAGVPWLRPYLRDTMKNYLGEVETKISENRLTALPDLEQIQAAIRGGGIPALLQSTSQRENMEKIQATMALIEGYAEHVMDAAGERLLSDYHTLRNAMQKRRKNRSQMEQLFLRVLGLEMKMRQYEDGRRFCNHVVDHYGIQTLNQVWQSADCLPSPAEIADAELWVKRVAPNASPVKSSPSKKKLASPAHKKPANLSSEAEEAAQEIEDEEYLLALVTGNTPETLLSEMQSWVIRAQEKNWIVTEGEAFVVTALGRKRLAEIISKDSL
jgi:coenzyme F420 biosynthesis associated uncharacterized protein